MGDDIGDVGVGYDEISDQEPAEQHAPPWEALIEDEPPEQTQPRAATEEADFISLSALEAECDEAEQEAVEKLEQARAETETQVRAGKRAGDQAEQRVLQLSEELRQVREQVRDAGRRTEPGRGETPTDEDAARARIRAAAERLERLRREIRDASAQAQDGIAELGSASERLEEAAVSFKGLGSSHDEKLAELGGAGCVLPPHRGLGSGRPPAHRTGHRRPGNGDLEPPARPRPGPSQRSGNAGRPPVEPAQYTSLSFSRRCTSAGIRTSTGSVADCFDNAVTESFFATLETELLDRHHFATHAQAKAACFDFIEGFYNPRRRHFDPGHAQPRRVSEETGSTTALRCRVAASLDVSTEPGRLTSANRRQVNRASSDPVGFTPALQQTPATRLLHIRADQHPVLPRIPTLL